MTLPDHAVVRAPRVCVLSRPSFVEPDQLPVTWLGESTDGERVVEFAERLRTASRENSATRESREYLRTLTAKQDAYALDHASYSVLIEGISRSVVHELQRRLTDFALTEHSSRHVDAVDLRFVVPPAMLGSSDLERAWLAQMSAALLSYSTLVDALMTRYAWIGDKMQRRRMARDAAASVLPNCTESTLVLTGSVRAWRTLLAQLGSEQSELESRRLALCVLRALTPEAPAFFSDFEFYLPTDRHEAVRVVAR